MLKVQMSAFKMLIMQPKLPGKALPALNFSPAREYQVSLSGNRNVPRKLNQSEALPAKYVFQRGASKNHLKLVQAPVQGSQQLQRAEIQERNSDTTELNAVSSKEKEASRISYYRLHPTVTHRNVYSVARQWPIGSLFCSLFDWFYFIFLCPTYMPTIFSVYLQIPDFFSSHIIHLDLQFSCNTLLVSYLIIYFHRELPLWKLNC